MTWRQRALRVSMLTHRCLGALLALPVLLWFLSGVVLMYVPYPRLLEAERLDGLPPLSLSAVEVSADEARDSVEGEVDRLRLGTLGGRPVWRARTTSRRHQVVYADRAGGVVEVDAALARELAAKFAHVDVSRVSQLGGLDRDQWTVTGLEGMRPLHHLSVDDAAHTELYVSSVTAEIVRDTTRLERVFGWAGPVVHWIYPTALRERPALWRIVVLALSSVALLAVVSGGLVGIWRARMAREKGKGLSQRRGVFRIHHLLGLAGLPVMICFVLSGLFSMSPLAAWKPASGAAALRAALFEPPRTSPGVSALRAMGALELPLSHDEDPLVEVELVGLVGAPLVRFVSRGGEVRVFDGHGAPLRPATVEAAIRAAASAAQVGVLGVDHLEAFDAYYYERRTPRPLPVLRVRLDDPAASSLYIDPDTGELLLVVDAEGRRQRYLYAALHTWDLPFLLARPRLREALLLSAIALGTALSVTALVLAYRRARPR